jgi:hypothetical protein
MVDALALRQIFSIESAAWAFVALCFLFLVRLWNGAPGMFAQWIDYRRARAAEKAADWERLRDEIKRLADAEQQCRRDFQELHTQHMNVVERLSSLEGYMAGQGRASQEAAGIVAIERLEEERNK